MGFDARGRVEITTILGVWVQGVGLGVWSLVCRAYGEGIRVFFRFSVFGLWLGLRFRGSRSRFPVVVAVLGLGVWGFEFREGFGLRDCCLGVRVSGLREA